MKGFMNVILLLGLAYVVLTPTQSRSVPQSEVVTTNGYITAVLRSECTDAPTPPPPVGQTAIGPDYVIMTVAMGNPLDLTNAQRVVTDAVFQSLMPLYCGLPTDSGIGCVTNRVQWNIITYDPNGMPRMSAGPTSGSAFHYFDPCPPTLQARLGQLIASVERLVATGLIDEGDGRRLTTRLDSALGKINSANDHAAAG